MPNSPPILWLASYPRSGNTWLRFLLGNYFLGPADDWVAGANRVCTELEHHVTFARENGLSEAQTIERVARRFREWLEHPESTGELLFKTHVQWSDRHPFADRSSRAVLLVRHPANVLLSSIRFLQLRERKRAKDPVGYARSFVEHGGDAVWRDRLDYGTWDEHARGWLDQDRFPVLLVRYEDLQERTLAELLRILEYLGVDPDEQRARRAIDGAALDRLRELESAARSQGRFPGAKSDEHHFIRDKGRAGSLEELDPSLTRRFQEVFGRAMARFDYS